MELSTQRLSIVKKIKMKFNLVKFLNVCTSRVIGTRLFKKGIADGTLFVILLILKKMFYASEIYDIRNKLLQLKLLQTSAVKL